jgi:cation-transporting ATPase 13A3/4/5
LQFLGLLVMENKLKPESTPALKTLNECEIRTVLATGDNVLTAISVAKNCKMLNGEKALYLGELKQQDVVWTRIEGSESKNAPKNQGSNGLPWSFDDPNIEVALTGPAFNQI